MQPFQEDLPSPPEPLRPKRRHVVTAFVQRADGRVIVVQRSKEVSSYCLKWGGVSGGVEEGDACLLDRALDEVGEELGLPRSAVRLVRTGRTLLVDDGPSRRFAVHPFLLSLGEEYPPISLNWENVAFRWVHPSEMAELDVVPQLTLTAQRVLLAPQQEAALARLAADRDHGATQLAGWVLDALQELLDQRAAALPADGPGLPELDALADFGYHLSSARPAIAPLANAAINVLAGVDADLLARSDPFDRIAREVWVAAQQSILSERQRLAAATDAVVAAAAALLRDGDTVMTISYSSTILNTFQAAAAGGKRLRVVVCESRPLCEGVRLADALASAGVEVQVVTDAQAALFVRGCNLALVGADGVGEAGVTNKVGTHLLALAARATGVPLYAVADASKVDIGPMQALLHAPALSAQCAARGAGDSVAQAEDYGAQEVAAGWPSQPSHSFPVHNVYFEATPLPLVSGLVTEAGPLTQEGVPLVEQRVKQMVDQQRRRALLAMRVEVD